MTAQDTGKEHDTEMTEEEMAAGPEVNEEETDAEPVSDDPVEVLEAALDKARFEAVEAKEDMLRMQADMENLRKRLVRQIRRFRPEVVSRAGAVGLMQLMPKTARSMSERSSVNPADFSSRVHVANEAFTHSPQIAKAPARALTSQGWPRVSS